MANTVGKISGQMLENNLLRADMATGDENLAFENELLFLNVFDKRVGINTDIPHRQLVVNSNLKTTNLIVDNLFTIPNFQISSNTISNDVGNILVTSPVTIGAGGLSTQGISIDAGFIKSLRSNEDIDLVPAGSGKIYFYSNVEVAGNVHATGNVTFDGSITIGNSDTDNVDMYCADIAHNVAALDVFNKTNNVQQLHDNIMLQDTLVREEYINVLRYIEQNNLIAADCFCCI